MGPHSVDAAAIGLALAGVDYEHLVDLAVIVPVVVGEVHFRVGGRASFDHHLVGVHVVALRVVLAVVFLVLLQRVGTHHVEVQLELTGALCLEVVGH